MSSDLLKIVGPYRAKMMGDHPASEGVRNNVACNNSILVHVRGITIIFFNNLFYSLQQFDSCLYSGDLRWK
jgi:hypothetical protein